MPELVNYHSSPNHTRWVYNMHHMDSAVSFKVLLHTAKENTFRKCFSQSGMWIKNWKRCIRSKKNTVFDKDVIVYPSLNIIFIPSFIGMNGLSQSFFLIYYLCFPVIEMLCLCCIQNAISIQKTKDQNSFAWKLYIFGHIFLKIFNFHVCEWMNKCILPYN